MPLTFYYRWDTLRDRLPTIKLVDQMRGLPLFVYVSVDELFRIVAAGHQTRHEAGTTLFDAGATPGRLHLLLDGEVLVGDGGIDAEAIRAPAALGFEEALDGRVMKDTIRALGPVVSVSLTKDELRTLLAQNTDLVRGLFRTIAARRHADKGFIRGSATTDLERLCADAPTALDKGIALRRIPLFARVDGAEMLHLSGIARIVHVDAGTTLTEESAPGSVNILLNGELVLREGESEDVLWRATPGDILGMYEILAGFGTEPGQWRLSAPSETAVLQVERDELFDLLEQRPALLQQIFAALFERASASTSPTPEPAVEAGA